MKKTCVGMTLRVDTIIRGTLGNMKMEKYFLIQKNLKRVGCRGSKGAGVEFVTGFLRRFIC